MTGYWLLVTGYWLLVTGSRMIRKRIHQRTEHKMTCKRQVQTDGRKKSAQKNGRVTPGRFHGIASLFHSAPHTVFTG
ncbi:hypothetical protein C9I92_02460 [Photobacterium ganghwense]|nr:hypothetical protein C9I92_02460 [Photobacterium ganghwense]